MSRNAIVDASVAVKWLIEEEGSDQAELFLRSAGEIHAPRIILGEVANALWKNVRRQTIRLEASINDMANLPLYINVLFDTDDLMIDALNMACAFDHPVYDCLYLASAQHFNLPLVTADARLLRKFSGTAYAGDIVPLSQWRP